MDRTVKILLLQIIMTVSIDCDETLTCTCACKFHVKIKLHKDKKADLKNRSVLLLGSTFFSFLIQTVYV